MRALKGFIAAAFILAVISGVGYGVLTVRRQAAARSLENIVIEPTPPQSPTPEEKDPIDPRLEGLVARADGVRLLWAPEEWERPLFAGFADNGTLIVSATSSSGKESSWKILRVDVASASATAIFDSSRPRTASSHRAAHRNVGTLCYASPDERGVSEIWCSNLEGKNEKQVTKHDGKEDLIAPAISPDGAWIAFEVNDDRLKKPTGASVWKIGLNGANIQQLTRGADDRSPTWSDDGRKIYFQRRVVGSPTSPDGLRRASWDAYVMDSDGKNPGPLLRTHEENEISPVRRGTSDIFILAEGRMGESTRIKSLDAVTKAGNYLTSSAYGAETSPSISPDGALVSFLAPLSPEEPDKIGLWLVQFDH